STFPGLVHGETDRVSPHPAGQADAERARGKLSRATARGMPGYKLVSELIRCPAEDRGVAEGVQRGASAQQSGLLPPNQFAERSRGKDGGKSALENASACASGVSHFSTAPATAAGIEFELTRRIMPSTKAGGRSLRQLSKDPMRCLERA